MENDCGALCVFDSGFCASMLMDEIDYDLVVHWHAHILSQHMIFCFLLAHRRSFNPSLSASPEPPRYVQRTYSLVA
nr:hypothetical protein CFP56_33512 [Quercus suber]